MRYNFYKKFDDIKLKGDIDSKIYSPVIYSDFKSAKLKVNLDASYDFKFFKGSVGYDGEFLKDESNKETSINLFSKGELYSIE